MPYHEMSPGEVLAFLGSDPPHTGKLATTRPDGSPHVAPIWFALDDGVIVFNTGEKTMKGRGLRRDPRVAFCVDDERPPFSFALVRGSVEIIEDLEQVRHWARVLGGRYMGGDRADEYGDRNGVPGELLVRLPLEHVSSARDLAG